MLAFVCVNLNVCIHLDVCVLMGVQVYAYVCVFICECKCPGGPVCVCSHECMEVSALQLEACFLAQANGCILTLLQLAS